MLSLVDSALQVSQGVSQSESAPLEALSSATAFLAAATAATVFSCCDLRLQPVSASAGASEASALSSAEALVAALTLEATDLAFLAAGALASLAAGALAAALATLGESSVSLALELSDAELDSDPFDESLLPLLLLEVEPSESLSPEASISE